MDKNKKIALISDLNRYKNKKVTLLFVGGKTVTGKLVRYDENANCLIQCANSVEEAKNILCIGRSITMICNGAQNYL